MCSRTRILDKMNKSTLKFLSKLSVIILCIIGLAELALALWTVFDNRYKSLAYNLADVGYIDLWILRYLSLCLFASSIITLVMCLILIWGLCSTHVFLFIASTMIVLVFIGEFTISIITFTSKYQTRLTLMEQLPKLVITYRQGTDERAKRALDILQLTFRCCGADGRLSYQNNVPLSCNMFSVGCLTRTMYFLDASMDSLSIILLFFSLIKLLIILFFYSFLCFYRRHRKKRRKSNRDFMEDSSIWRHSSSFDSSSTDNLPRKTYILPSMTNQEENENEYAEKRHILPNTTNASIIYYEPNTSRKLSSISERTEKTEVDESELDLLRSRPYPSKRKGYITTIQQRKYPPPLPIIKSRRRIIRGDDDDDSGVERSSSEKSFDDHKIQKQHTKPKSPTSLSFSKVFVTSVSQVQPTNDEVKQPLTTSISDNLLLNDITTPKSILKKIHPQPSSVRTPPSYRNQQKSSSIYIKTPPLLHHGPKIIPRTYIKQSKQDESPF